MKGKPVLFLTFLVLVVVLGWPVLSRAKGGDSNPPENGFTIPVSVSLDIPSGFMGVPCGSGCTVGGVFPATVFTEGEECPL